MLLLLLLLLRNNVQLVTRVVSLSAYVFSSRFGVDKSVLEILDLALQCIDGDVLELADELAFRVSDQCGQRHNFILPVTETLMGV